MEQHVHSILATNVHLKDIMTLALYDYRSPTWSDQEEVTAIRVEVTIGVTCALISMWEDVMLDMTYYGSLMYLHTHEFKITLRINLY